METPIAAAGAEPHGQAAPRNRRRRWYRLLSAVFMAALLWAIISRGQDIAWAEVVAALRAYEPRMLVCAGLLALGGHLAAASYDLIARRTQKVPLAVSTVVAINFVSYTFSINLGALLGGWASRARLYARLGIAAPQIARVLALAVLSNWSGFVLLGGVLLCAGAPLLPEAVPLSALAQTAIGALMLAVVGGYLLLCVHADRLDRWPALRVLREILPGLRLALLQLALSISSWLLMALSLWTLLPAAIAPLDAIAALMIASVAGAVLHVPGNLGVLEASLGHLLGGQLPTAQLLAAALAFRVVYYLLPFVLAGITFVTLELRARRARTAASRR